MDLEKLFSTYKVLPPRPAWKAVEQALVELESEGHDEESSPEKEDRLAMVRQFATALVDRGETLSQTLACTAVLGRTAGGEGLGQWVEAGLDAIASCAAFRESSSESVRRIVGTLYERRLDKPEAFGEIGEPATLAPGTVDAWHEWLVNIETALANETVWSPVELDAARAKAWENARERLLDHLEQVARPSKSTPADLVPPTADLLCAVRKVTPATRVAARPESMTLGAWSTLVYLALRDAAPDSEEYCPAWVAFLAGRRLGLPGLKRSALEELASKAAKRHQARSADERTEMEALGICVHALDRLDDGEDKPTEPGPALLIVRPPAHPISASWSVDPTPVAITLTPAQILDLMGPTKMEIVGPGVSDVVIEIPEEGWPAGENKKLDEAISALDGLGRSLDIYHMPASRKAPHHGDGTLPRIVDPGEVASLRRRIVGGDFDTFS